MALIPEIPPTPEIPLTGPAALEHALGKLNLDELEQRHRNLISNGPKSKRTKSVQALNSVEGLRRNNLQPNQLLVRHVPVIPPAFRPFSVLGDTFVPGDANELYRDLFLYRDAYKEASDVFGEHNSGQARTDLYDTVKALYGYGQPIAPKTAQRGVSGFLKQVTGTSPKFSFFQRKLLSKTQDSVARGTISIDPELSLDEIGVPEHMAWTMYAPYIQRRLVRSGLSSKTALEALRDRTEQAKRSLLQEMEERPIVYSRAPSWHKFNVIAGRPKLIEGSTISVNPMITTGMNADFDGDAMNLHVPSQADAVKEAWDVLMPSKMLFSIRDQDKVVPSLKHEQVLGLYTANRRPSQNNYQFTSEEEALKAIRAGKVRLSDEIEIMESK
jgi:DNA-directed RNA polymerase subunit beta'